MDEIAEYILKTLSDAKGSDTMRFTQCVLIAGPDLPIGIAGPRVSGAH